MNPASAARPPVVPGDPDPVSADPGTHHDRRGLTATKNIEQAGLAHRRSRLAFAGSDMNSAAWAAMNASRVFPPYSGCRRVSMRSSVPARVSRVLTGTDRMKKFRSAIVSSGTGTASISASIAARSAARRRRRA